jgi:hypothetical protein
MTTLSLMTAAGYEAWREESIPGDALSKRVGTSR